MPLTNEQITDRRKADQPDAADLTQYRDYASGNHPDILTTSQERLIQQRAAHRAVDNVIGLVLKTAASRLRLESWDVNPEVPVTIDTNQRVTTTARDQTQTWLAHLWLINRVKRLQYETHYAMLRDGNSALSLSWRGGMPRITREPWWDGTTGAYIAYTDAGEYEFAVREWKQREPSGDVIVRRTVYEPGVIHRWVQKGDGWQPYNAPGVETTQAWIRPNGKPLPIPWVHFPNGSGVTDSVYGQSDIAALMALQDDLNALQRDLTASALLTAFQRLFFSGVGNQSEMTVAPGEAQGTENVNAKVTVIEPGDMSQLTDVHAYKRNAMAIGSSTPIHAITGDWPSGAALLRADMPMIEKVEALADVAGPQWTMVAHRCMEIANAFGTIELDENVPITSVFAAAERIDEATKLELDQKRADLWETISRLPKTAMLKTGLVDEAEADALIEERDAGLEPVADMATQEV